MSAAIQMKGLWVWSREATRYRSSPEFDGLIDLDVSKMCVALKHCSRRGVALDIGAHIGATTVYLAKHFRRVESFEAIPDTFDLLQRNTSHLANVVVRNVAAADKEGELYFEHLEGHTQLSHAMSGRDRYYEGQDSQVVGPVAGQPLDSFNFADVSFIKIDVEGTELDVVRGLQHTILANKPVIIMEQNKNEAKYHGRAEDEGTDFLLQLGMRRIERFPYKRDRLFAF